MVEEDDLGGLRNAGGGRSRGGVDGVAGARGGRVLGVAGEASLLSVGDEEEIEGETYEGEGERGRVEDGETRLTGAVDGAADDGAVMDVDGAAAVPPISTNDGGGMVALDSAADEAVAG